MDSTNNFNFSIPPTVRRIFANQLLPADWSTPFRKIFHSVRSAFTFGDPIENMDINELAKSARDSSRHIFIETVKAD
jgi:hypothetical protein